MQTIAQILDTRVRAAIKLVLNIDEDPLIRPAKDPKFGDYQANGIMHIAKPRKLDPVKLAKDIRDKLDVSDLCTVDVVHIFINFKIKPEFLAGRLLDIAKDKSGRLGILKTDKPKTVVVDFSGPNIAKQMHVGHLRSTIIGDTICRLLEFEGHNVIPQNHIGDWGTQFGMLICYFYQRFPTASFKRRGASIVEVSGVSVRDMNIPDMEVFYREAKKLYDSDPDFASKSREYVVKLQSGDKQVLAIWQFIRDQSLCYSDELYHKLNVTLKREHVRGESEYNAMLPDVVKELKDKGIAVESEGAVCVFPPGFKNKEGQDLPLIIQKSDGAFLYATTDLAAIKFRVSELKADEIIYVTDARQSLHFEMVFAVARMTGWAPANVELKHVTFGSVLGEDGKPFKTRTGENVKLRDLLDEAVIRARKVVDEKNPDFPQEQKADIAKTVGVGAVKYADLSNNRTSDYVFSFDRMLALEGNTAPYMQYAYARVKSIERKALERQVDAASELADIKKAVLIEPGEIELAKQISRYDEAIFSATEDFRPNYITAYLFDLAVKFSSFYTQCPVLTAPADKRPTRLLLCDLTAKIIEHGLTDLLGIGVVEQM